MTEKKPRKLIKELYSSCEHVDSWRSVRLHVTRRSSNDSIIGLKWPLDSSFTADFKVRTFQNGFLSAYFNLLSKLTAEGQISAFLTDFVKLSRR